MKVAGNKAMTVVVMQNLFYTNLAIHQKFDLKGSTVKRFVTDEEIDKGVTVLKDLNFRLKIHLSPSIKQIFLSSIKNDAHFLRESNIMDYSLLLGINDNGDTDSAKGVALVPLERPTVWQQKDGGIPTSNERSETYFFGKMISLGGGEQVVVVVHCVCWSLCSPVCFISIFYCNRYH